MLPRCGYKDIMLYQVETQELYLICRQREAEVVDVFRSYVVALNNLTVFAPHLGLNKTRKRVLYG